MSIFLSGKNVNQVSYEHPEAKSAYHVFNCKTQDLISNFILTVTETSERQYMDQKICDRFQFERLSAAETNCPAMKESYKDPNYSGLHISVIILLIFNKNMRFVISATSSIRSDRKFLN